MRVNFPCENCSISYTLQMPDGIGEVGISITCPCGNVVSHEFVTPEQQGQIVWVVAKENIKGQTKLGG